MNQLSAVKILKLMETINLKITPSKDASLEMLESALRSLSILGANSDKRKKKEEALKSDIKDK